MLQLNPIDRRIRQELHFREASIAKKGGLSDPTGVQIPATFYPLGTVWIKMTSPVKNGAVMLGSEMEDPAGDQSFSKMKHGFNEMYTQPITDGGNKIEPSYFRPLPGIKDITSTYAGGMKAIRNATVNWSCFSLADLERLTPYFLSHGTSILLEWGWTSDNVGQTFTMQEIKEGQCYTNIQKKIFKNGGNYDAMCGIVKNYAWTLREDGGFDCTTDITSLGVNMIDSKVKQQLDLDYTLMETVKEETDKETKTYVLVPKVTMPKYIKDLANQLEKYVSPSPPGNSKGEPPSKPGVLRMKKDGDLLHPDANVGPYVTWGWMEDNIISKFLSKVNETKGIILSDMRSIIDDKSVIIANHPDLVTTDRKSFILPGQWPAERLKDTTFTDVMNKHMSSPEPPAVSVMKEKVLEMTGGKHIWKVMETLHIDKLVDGLSDLIETGKAAIKATLDVKEWLGDDFHEAITREIATKANRDFDKFAISENLNDGGYLRNILIHWETIERAFGEVETVEAGLKNLFTEINRDMSLWDFTITNNQNTTGRMMVIDLNHVNDSVEDLLTDENESRWEAGAVQGKLYKFKTWREETLTKNQTMEAKLPSSMAVAAMYGRNTESAGVGEEDPAGEGAGVMHKDEKDPILGPMTRGWEHANFGLLDPNPDDGAIPPLTVDGGPVLGALTPDDTDKVLLNTEGKSGEQKEAGVSVDDTADYRKLMNQIRDLSQQSWDGESKSKTTTLPAELHIYDQFGNMKLDLIPKLKAILHGEPGTDERPSKAKQDTLLPIELSITIDGIGGIYPGNVFTADYIPKRYRKTCVFQVKSLEHTVNADGWDITITGQIRLALAKIGDAIRELKAEK